MSNNNQIVNVLILSQSSKKRKMNPKSLKNLKPKRQIKNITSKVKLLPPPKKKMGMVEGFISSTGKVIGGMVKGTGYYAIQKPYTKKEMINLNAKRVKK